MVFRENLVAGGPWAGPPRPDVAVYYQVAAARNCCTVVVPLQLLENHIPPLFVPHRDPDLVTGSRLAVVGPC